QRTAAHLVAQRLAFQEFKDDEDAPLVLADVEDRRDVRVRQRNEAARPLDERLVMRGVYVLFRQHANDDGAAFPRVARAEQFSGPCRGQPLEQVVMRDDCDRTRNGRRHSVFCSITVCSSSLASPICSMTSAMSSVGRPGTRVLWQ